MLRTASANAPRSRSYRERKSAIQTPTSPAPIRMRHRSHPMETLAAPHSPPRRALKMPTPGCTPGQLEGNTSFAWGRWHGQTQIAALPFL